MEPEVLMLLAEQGGVALRAQLLELVTLSRLRVLVRHGALAPVRHGVYADGTLASSTDLVERAQLEARADLLVRRREEVVTGRSAATVHGLPLLGGAGPLRTALPRSPDERRRTQRAAVWLPDDEVVEVGGVRVTSLARTVVDLARSQPFAAAVVPADAALRLGLDRDEAHAVLERCRQWPGARAARRVLEFADARADSPLESLGRARFEEAGLPRPQLQQQIGPYLVDHYWQQQRTVGEADGELKYRERGAVFREKKREDHLRDGGFEVVRYDWAEALRTPRLVVARLLRAFDRTASRAS